MIPLIPPSIAGYMLLEIFIGFVSIVPSLGNYGVRWDRWFVVVLILNSLFYLIYCAVQPDPEVFNALGY